MFVCNGFACCLRLSILGRSLAIEGIFLLLLLCLLSVGCFSRSARFDRVCLGHLVRRLLVDSGIGCL